jgi:hypothetical protein
VEPFQNGGLNYFALFQRDEGKEPGKPTTRPMPPGNYVAKSLSGKSAFVHDFFSYDDFPGEGRLLLNGETVTLSKLETVVIPAATERTNEQRSKL